MKKFDKKTKILITFCLGAVLFVTSAFAEVRTQTGYEQLKEAAKATMFNMASYDSFTTKINVTISDNDKIVLQNEGVERTDNKDGKSESTSRELGIGGIIRNNYNYSDSTQRIYYNQYDDTYYVHTYRTPYKPVIHYVDPIGQTMVGEFEKILDAGIAALNLQNSIIADKGADGRVVLVSSLGEGQIPPFINALFSFIFKQTYSHRASVVSYTQPANFGEFVETENDIPQGPFPALDGDVYIKSFEGRVIVNEDGIIEGAHLTAVLSGKEKNGTLHDITFELTAEVTDINTTVIDVPDLTGKKVVVQEDKYGPNASIAQAFVGEYKQEVLKLQDNVFVKTGEKRLEIESIKDGIVTAVYYELVDAVRINEIDIHAIVQSANFASFDLKNQGNTQEDIKYRGGGYLNFNEIDGTIHFSYENNYGTFTRILD